MFEIDVQNPNRYPVDRSRLIAAIEAALTHQKAAPQATVTVMITDDASVKALNQQFRGIDSPTDVLSFPAQDAETVASGIEEADDYLGDLIIAYPYAQRQAERDGHALMDSFSLLVVHGTLHLLGYDHDTPQNRATMWRVQGQILDLLGISQQIVPALEGTSSNSPESTE